MFESLISCFFKSNCCDIGVVKDPGSLVIKYPSTFCADSVVMADVSALNHWQAAIFAVLTWTLRPIAFCHVLFLRWTFRVYWMLRVAFGPRSCNMQVNHEINKIIRVLVFSLLTKRDRAPRTGGRGARGGRRILGRPTQPGDQCRWSRQQGRPGPGPGPGGRRSEGR